MENLLTYVLQVNLLLALIYLGYRLLLKEMTFYHLNRIYFVIGSIYAFVNPFLNIKSWFKSNELVKIEHLPEFLGAIEFAPVEKVSFLSLDDVILSVIAVVGIVFISRLCIQLFSLLRIHRYSKVMHWNSYLFRNVIFPVVPFSFFNKIYIHKEQHQENELQDIFAHETIHVRGHHTIDILLFEIILVVCWYNPFVWLMRKAVRQNLEFLTDQQVLNKGVDKQTYQYSLLHVTQKGAAVAMSNHFNFKTLKKRIMMMNKKRSSKLELSKYAFLLPVLLIAGMSFTVTKAESGIENIVEKSQQTSIIDEPLNVKMRGEVGELLKNTIGTDILAIDTSNQQIYNAEYPLVSADFDRNELRGKEFYFKIDDKQVSLDEFYDFPRNEIFGVDIYSNKDEIFKKIGKQNAEGLFVISTIKWAEKNLPVEHLEKLVNDGNMRGLTFTVEENGKKRLIKGQSADMNKLKEQFPHVYDVRKSNLQSDTTKVITVKGKRLLNELSDIKKILIVIDGKEQELGFDLNTISPNDIESISVLKDQSATTLYGDKGKDGVIIIVTKEFKRKQESKIQTGITSEIQKDLIIDNRGSSTWKRDYYSSLNNFLNNNRSKIDLSKGYILIIDNKLSTEEDLKKISNNNVEQISATDILGNEEIKVDFSNRLAGILRVTTTKNKSNRSNDMSASVSGNGKNYALIIDKKSSHPIIRIQ